jgi:hypothetical protein
MLYPLSYEGGGCRLLGGEGRRPVGRPSAGRYLASLSIRDGAGSARGVGSRVLNGEAETVTMITL